MPTNPYVTMRDRDGATTDEYAIPADGATTTANPHDGATTDAYGHLRAAGCSEDRRICDPYETQEGATTNAYVTPAILQDGATTDTYVTPAGGCKNGASVLAPFRPANRDKLSTETRTSDTGNRNWILPRKFTAIRR